MISSASASTCTKTSIRMIFVYITKILEARYGRWHLEASYLVVDGGSCLLALGLQLTHGGFEITVQLLQKKDLVFRNFSSRTEYITAATAAIHCETATSGHRKHVPREESRAWRPAQP